jgi:small subunit ribosomal protein S4
MIRKKKLYVKPRKLYIATRIKEENVLLKKYGLKSKREIWKTLAKISYFRSRAKALAKASQEEQQLLFSKLQNLGLKTFSTADVLALTLDNLLERRLSTVVFRKGLANSPQHARQLIVHKKILIENKVLDVPSYIVPVEEESKITVKASKTKPKEEIKGENK